MLDVYIDNGIPASKRMPDFQILDDFLDVFCSYLEDIEKKYHLGIDIYGTFRLDSSQATFLFNEIEKRRTLLSSKYCFNKEYVILGQLQAGFSPFSNEPLLFVGD